MELNDNISECYDHNIYIIDISARTNAVAQSFRVFASHVEGWVFESQPRQTYVVKTGSDSSTAKYLATGVSVTGPQR